MPAAILEQSSEPTSPVFVAGGRRRNLGVRLIAAALGLLLAGWLAALAAGLIGFSPLPELALPGTGNGQTAAAAPEQGARGCWGTHRGQRSRTVNRFASGWRGSERGESPRARRLGQWGQWGRDRKRPGVSHRIDAAGDRGRTPAVADNSAGWPPADSSELRESAVLHAACQR